jgi:hypothetical protein
MPHTSVDETALGTAIFEPLGMSASARQRRDPEEVVLAEGDRLDPSLVLEQR